MKFLLLNKTKEFVASIEKVLFTIINSFPSYIILLDMIHMNHNHRIQTILFYLF